MNIRTAPNGGDIIETLDNGTQVRVIGTQPDARGRNWSQIERVGHTGTIGWVYRDYIDCTSTPPNGGEKQPQPARPPIETPALKEAGAFLEDSKGFIANQKSVPGISTIANEAATLQIAINKIDEPAAVQSVQRLTELLKPIPGFVQFEQQQRANRQREKARMLAEAQTDSKRNMFFIDSYMKDHLGDPTTGPLLKLRDQIETSVKANTIDEISKANIALSDYITQNGLSDAYGASTTEFSNPTERLPENPKTLAERLGISDKSKFVIEGSRDDIILLYNSSPTAPGVWKNVRGDIVFQNDAASLCFVKASDIAIERYVERILADRGVKQLTTVKPPCDLSKAVSGIDIIAFQRGDLLKSREDSILGLVKMVEGDTFRKYEIISDYATTFQNRQTQSLQIETDVDSNTRKGFGVIGLAGPPVACIITPEKAERSDGLKELLRRNTDLIAPTMTSDWQSVDTANTDVAFLGLQRRQCGYVAGEASALRSIMLALRRDKLKYVFAPVWWDEKEVDQATFDVNDNIRIAIIKKDQRDQAAAAQAALDDQRERDKQTNKTEIERKLRDKYGVKARGLKNVIHDLVSGVAQQRVLDSEGIFRSYSAWMDGRFTNHWETFDVSSEIADFGLAQWQRRSLDAIVVRTIIHQKNRILGRYDEPCYMFGLIDDEEFNMWRESFAVECNDTGFVSRWKIGKSFQSEWNAD